MAHGNAKYSEWLTEEGLIKLEGWATDGLTDEQIAANIGISRSTLSEWKNRFPKIADTLKKGKDIADRKVEKSLFENAMGYEYEDVKTTIEERDGVIVKRKEIVKKYKHGDTTAQIFWLKNRKPKEWRDAHEHAVKTNVKDSEQWIKDWLDELNKK